MRFTSGYFRGFKARQKRPARRSIQHTVEQLEDRQLLSAELGELVYGPTGPRAEAVSSPSDEDGSPHTTPLPPNWRAATPTPSGAGGQLHPLTALPKLNSYPQSSINLYLDFDGHFQADWGGLHGLRTPAYTADDDETTFSDAELSDIAEIFARIAEDFAPFAINVTTEEPADLGDGKGVRIAIGGRWEDWYRDPVGGIALINCFTNEQPNVVYTFARTLAVPKTIAEASSHEAGHAFGLWHQSEYNASGKKVTEYYAGDETGAPIMGLSYLKDRSRWWQGTSTSASTMQDDLAVLSRPDNLFGYRPDDHGNSAQTGTRLLFLENRALTAGVVEQGNDVDVFLFDVVQSEQFRIDYRAAAIGANLDVHIELRTIDGELIDERTTFHDNNLALGRTLETGQYQILIRSDGTYGSLGQYRLQVTEGNDPSLPPTTPGDFAGTYLSPTAVEFTWVEALGETRYELYASREVGKQIESFTVTLPENSSRYTLTGYGVLNGWQYVLQAINSVGSVESDVCTPSEIPVVAPQNVQGTAFTRDSSIVSWNAVPGAWAYIVKISAANTPQLILQEIFVDGTRDSTVVRGLMTEIDYLITVTARNSLGDAANTPITTRISDVADPGTKLLPPGLTASATGPFSINFNWTTPPGASWIQIQQKRRKEWITLQVLPSTTTAINLLPDGELIRNKFRVVAADGNTSATSKVVKLKRPLPAWRSR